MFRLLKFPKEHFFSRIKWNHKTMLYNIYRRKNFRTGVKNCDFSSEFYLFFHPCIKGRKKERKNYFFNISLQVFINFLNTGFEILSFYCIIII